MSWPRACHTREEEEEEEEEEEGKLVDELIRTKTSQSTADQLTTCHTAHSRSRAAQVECKSHFNLFPSDRENKPTVVE